MPTTTCHCGAVRIGIQRKPRHLTSCNCSICRRYGALWAYFKSSEVKITAAGDKTCAYVWGNMTLQFVRCKDCGCVIAWERLQPKKTSKMGVNMRNFDPGLVASARIRRFDGAATWEYLD